MYPIIFQYNNFIISSYGLMLMLAFLICNYLLKKYLIKINEDETHADNIIFYAALGGIVGSKIYFLIERAVFEQDYTNIYGFLNIFKGLFLFDFPLVFQGISEFGSGLVFLGGLIGGMLTVTYYIKSNNLKWLVVADWVAPYLILGHAIGRIGCFLVGDCYGKPTDLPWKCSFVNGLPPTTYNSFKFNYPNIFNNENFQSIYKYNDIIYVHPTQIYEFLIYIIIFFYLIIIRSKNRINGFIMFEYLFLAGISRFIIEFLRLNPKYIFGLTGAQIISLIMIISGSYLMYSFNSKYGKLNGKN